MSSIAPKLSLTARLIKAQFGNLFSTINDLIVSFDPETATEADRDQLQAKLREAVTQMVGARTAYAKEAKDVTDLKALIANDESAGATLAAQFAAGTLAEATLTAFLDEVEANKARLPDEEAEAAESKAVLGEIQDLVDVLEKHLADFDAHAKKIRNQLASAEAAEAAAKAKLERQEQMKALKTGLGDPSSALGALAKRAGQAQQEAAVAKEMAAMGQKPLDQADLVAKARAAAAGTGAPVGETTAERLSRLFPSKEAVPA